MKILAYDLSLTAAGIARPDGTTETINPGARRDAARLAWLTDELAFRAYPTGPLLEHYPWGVVDLVVIEDCFAARNSSSVPLAMLHGAIRVDLHRLNIPFVVVSPASVKRYATGKGNAPKPDLRMALFQRAGIDQPDDNQVDAWWLRAMALDQYGTPIVSVPAANREALTKVAWPDVPAFTA